MNMIWYFYIAYVLGPYVSRHEHVYKANEIVNTLMGPLHLGEIILIPI